MSARSRHAVSISLLLEGSPPGVGPAAAGGSWTVRRRKPVQLERPEKPEVERRLETDGPWHELLPEFQGS